MRLLIENALSNVRNPKHLPPGQLHVTLHMSRDEPTSIKISR